MTNVKRWAKRRKGVFACLSSIFLAMLFWRYVISLIRKAVLVDPAFRHLLDIFVSGMHFQFSTG